MNDRRAEFSHVEDDAYIGVKEVAERAFETKEPVATKDIARNIAEASLGLSSLI